MATSLIITMVLLGCSESKPPTAKLSTANREKAPAAAAPPPVSMREDSSSPPQAPDPRARAEEILKKAAGLFREVQVLEADLALDQTPGQAGITYSRKVSLKRPNLGRITTTSGKWELLKVFDGRMMWTSEGEAVKQYSRMKQKGLLGTGILEEEAGALKLLFFDDWAKLLEGISDVSVKRARRGDLECNVITIKGFLPGRERSLWIDDQGLLRADISEGIEPFELTGKPLSCRYEISYVRIAAAENPPADLFLFSPPGDADVLNLNTVDGDWMVETGEPPPAILLYNAEEMKARLSDYAGRIVVLSFWSLASEVSLKQLSTLEEWKRQWGDRNVVFVAINGVDRPAKMADYFKREKLTLISWEAGKDCPLHCFPIVLLDVKGRVAAAGQNVATALEKMLQQK